MRSRLLYSEKIPHHVIVQIHAGRIVERCQEEILIVGAFDLRDGVDIGHKGTHPEAEPRKTERAHRDVRWVCAHGGIRKGPRLHEPGRAVFAGPQLCTTLQERLQRFVMMQLEAPYDLSVDVVFRQ